MKGKRTALAAAILALYGALKAFGVDINLPAGFEEVLAGFVFLILRVMTDGPIWEDTEEDDIDEDEPDAIGFKTNPEEEDGP